MHVKSFSAYFLRMKLKSWLSAAYVHLYRLYSAGYSSLFQKRDFCGAWDTVSIVPVKHQQHVVWVTAFHDHLGCSTKAKYENVPVSKETVCVN